MTKQRFVRSRCSGAWDLARSLNVVLNVVLPLIYVMNHTGVALASQTLGCTAVPDEFMDYCALQRLLLIRAAPQSSPSLTKICPLASVLLAASSDFQNTGALPKPPRRAQVRDFSS